MRLLIAGNWKMHGLAPQLEPIKAVAAPVKARSPDATILICVSPTRIDRADKASLSCIAIGGEDCSAEKAEAFTGDVNADMLRDATATTLGHSERRRLHRETIAEVTAEVTAAWATGLSTLVCIGGYTGAAKRGRGTILHGGSVKPPNAYAILEVSGGRDVLLEGASLMASDFDSILGVCRKMFRIPDGVATVMQAPCGVIHT